VAPSSVLTTASPLSIGKTIWSFLPTKAKDLSGTAGGDVVAVVVLLCVGGFVVMVFFGFVGGFEGLAEATHARAKASKPPPNPVDDTGG